MRIVHLAMEYKGITSPRYKLGNLIRAAAKRQAEAGHDVRVYMPGSWEIRSTPSDLVNISKVKVISQERLPMKEVLEKSVTLTKVEPLVSGADHPKLSLYLVENAATFNDFPLYGHPKEWALPWIVFPKAVIKHLAEDGYKPDIVHCHEWQPGLMPEYLRKAQGEGALPGAKTVFTPHSLSNLGLLPNSLWGSLGLSGHLFTPDAVEYFGNVSLLKAGMTADIVLFTSEEVLQRALVSQDPKGIADHLRQLIAWGKLATACDRQPSIDSDKDLEALGGKFLEYYKRVIS